MNTEKVSISSKKPRLSFWQIWNMSFGFLGIQFGFALQNANTSRIFESLGADKDNLAILWLAAPVTGLLVQPIIGYYSDRTWHPKWGRRRPFFAIGAILASIALVIMPNSPVLWIAVGTLWLMDASINISMEPFRAFVGDMLPDEQRTKGFAMQSFFIGIGAIVASYLPYVFTNWIGLPNTTEDGGIAPSIKWSFYLGAIAFFGAVMWTVLSTKEYPPDEDQNEGEETESNASIGTRYAPNTYRNIGITLMAVGLLLIFWFATAGLDKKLFVVCGILVLFGLSYFVASYLMKKGNYRLGFVQIVQDFQDMPKTMVQLAFVQFFSWFALFSMWIYSTAGVTSHIYDMKVDGKEVLELRQYLDSNQGVLNKNLEADLNEEILALEKEIDKGKEAVVSMKLVNGLLKNKESLNISEGIADKLDHIQKEYNTGADWVGALFGNYNGFAAVAALFLPWLAARLGRKVTHLIALALGGIGLISFYYISNPDLLTISMIGVGIAWASILSMPYAILSAALPTNKMGYYMGIFNFFIVIPQIVAASILGFLVTQFFNSEFIYALVIGGSSMIISGFLTLLVTDQQHPEPSEG
ncbi:MAG: MFS transporter [Bacteroidota bacterium]